MDVPSNTNYRAWIEDRARVCTKLSSRLQEHDEYIVENIDTGTLDDLKAVFAELLQNEHRLRTRLAAREAMPHPPQRKSFRAA